MLYLLTVDVADALSLADVVDAAIHFVAVIDVDVALDVDSDEYRERFLGPKPTVHLPSTDGIILYSQN